MIKVLTDTTASLSKDDYQQAGIIPIPLLIREEYATKKDIFEIGPDEFYREQRKGTSYSTAHLEAEGFLDYFRPHVENGDEVICILLSGMISPCVKAAQRAVELLKTDRITIVDSRQSGFGQAYMAIKAKELAAQGARREEIVRNSPGCASGPEPISSSARWITSKRAGVSSGIKCSNLL